jgi:hypothetical protein
MSWSRTCPQISTDQKVRVILRRRCATAISSRRTRRSVQSVHVAPARRPASTERHPPHRPLEARQLPAGLAGVRTVRGVRRTDRRPGGCAERGRFRGRSVPVQPAQRRYCICRRERLRATSSANAETQWHTRSGLKRVNDPEPDDAARPPTRTRRNAGEHLHDRARCVPDRPDGQGIWRTLTDRTKCRRAATMLATALAALIPKLIVPSWTVLAGSRQWATASGVGCRRLSNQVPHPGGTRSSNR